jgi:hypothetical protein
MNTHELNDDQP